MYLTRVALSLTDAFYARRHAALGSGVRRHAWCTMFNACRFVVALYRGRRKLNLDSDRYATAVGGCSLICYLNPKVAPVASNENRLLIHLIGRALYLVFKVYNRQDNISVAYLMLIGYRLIVIFDVKEKPVYYI